MTELPSAKRRGQTNKANWDKSEDAFLEQQGEIEAMKTRRSYRWPEDILYGR